MGNVVAPYMTVAETAALLRMSTKTIRRMLEDGRLVAHRAGKNIRVDGPSVMRLMSGQSAPAMEPQMVETPQFKTELVRRLKYTKEWTGHIGEFEVALGTSEEDEARTRLIAAQSRWERARKVRGEVDAIQRRCVIVKEAKKGYIIRYESPSGAKLSKRISPELEGQLKELSPRTYAAVWYVANVEDAAKVSTGCSRPTSARSSSSGSGTTVDEIARRWFNGELSDQYGDEYVKRKKTATDDRLRYERYVAPVAGDTRMTDLQGEVVASLADRIVARVTELSPKASAATRRQVLQVYNRLLNIAVFPLRLLPRNDLPKGYLPSPKSKKAFSYIYPDEEAKLLACLAVPLHHRLFFGILDREGMRVSELRDLKWQNVDRKRGLVRLEVNKTDEPRTWKLREDVLEALKRWHQIQSPVVRRMGFIAAHPATGVRFPEGKAAPLLRQALQDAGVDRDELWSPTGNRMALRAHDLRATFVTLALAAGRSEAWVTDRTGHKSSQMVYKYKRAARTHAEASLGELELLHKAIPELADAEVADP